MKNLIIAIVVTMLVAALAWATKEDLPVDGKGIRLQACAPKPKNDAAITGNSMTFHADYALAPPDEQVDASDTVELPEL